MRLVSRLVEASLTCFGTPVAKPSEI